MKAMEAWLSRRAGAVRNLWVSRLGGVSFTEMRPGGELPATLLAAVLGIHAFKLRVLTTETAALALGSADLDAVLRSTRKLEHFSLCYSQQPACWDDQGAALMQTLSQLPALRSLSISAKHLAMQIRDKRPTLVELAALSSARLTRLEMDIDISSESTLSVGNLPALTDCRLGGYGSADVHVTASSLSGAPNLTALFTRGFRYIHLALDCLTSLSFLTDLRLINCKLFDVPSALAGVKNTLRHLDLSSKRSILELREIGFGVLLDLPILKHLVMIKHGVFENMPWNLQSTQYLYRFLIEWQAPRPGVKLPTLTL